MGAQLSLLLNFGFFLVFLLLQTWLALPNSSDHGSCAGPIKKDERGFSPILAKIQTSKVASAVSQLLTFSPLNWYLILLTIVFSVFSKNRGQILKEFNEQTQ